MSYIPTTLYIDTEVFDRNGLRFDTKDFRAIRDTFVKGGLRLLVPEMMERELIRHFHELAIKSTESVSKAPVQLLIYTLSLPSLPPAKELEEKCFAALKKQWEDFKGHFTVEHLPLVSRLTDVVDWYFNVDPPFSEKKPKEFPDAFILSTLDEYHHKHSAQIAVVSFDGDFSIACAKRSFLRHFCNLGDFIDAFKPELLKAYDAEIVDPTKPIATEDLTQMKSILGQGAKATEIERNRVIHLLSTRGTNFEYFFRNADNPLWIDLLAKEGYFSTPPAIEQLDNGMIRAPIWWPMVYLVRVFEQAQMKVIELLDTIPSTDNPHVLDGFLAIIIKSNSSDLIKRFYNRIELFLDMVPWGHDKIIALLAKPFLFDGKLVDVASAILLKIVEFKPDPRAAEKAHKSDDGLLSFATTLEPAPRLSPWEYQQVLDLGVRPLAEREPFIVARILVDATASMIRLRMNNEELEKSSDEDISEVWCPHLEKPELTIEGPKAQLVSTLTAACNAVYERSPESINALNQTMCNQRWKVFKRIRQYLYANHPNAHTLPWIREQIISYDQYGNREYHYEFQMMIRRSCEHFGGTLLSKDERRNIFDAILRGPSHDQFREWMGANYNEAAWTQRQRYFHHKQLRPFASVLFDEYQTAYQEHESYFKDDPLTDESYLPFGTSRGGFVSYRSPRSVEDLSKLNDEDLLTYINDWDEPGRDSKDWLVEINIGALSGAFQTVFKDIIVSDTTRLAFWLGNRDRIKRPVYVKAMIMAMQEITKSRKYEHLAQWLEFCDWILDRPNAASGAEDEGNDESIEKTNWRSCRRAVGDLIEVCVEEKVHVPFSAREALAGILGKLCNQFDYRLDCDRPILLNRDDPVTEAINNTRSRALETLVDFSCWIRRHDKVALLPELKNILEGRFATAAMFPLKLPERALLGLHFGRIWNLVSDWAEANKDMFFPQGDLPVWVAAFSAFIHYSQPFSRIYEVLKSEFAYALSHLDTISSNKDEGPRIIDILGQHLFAYYLWDVYPLNGENSLLGIFYDKTACDKFHWGRLFDHIGRNLRNSGPKLDEAIQTRILAFFEWRLAQKESDELKEFTFWLEAPCLDPDWRLDSFLKILDITQNNDVNLSLELDTLNEMLEQHAVKVVECFAKITDHIGRDTTLYIQTDKAKSILKAGLNNPEEVVRANAERARENLLKAGLFDFLESGE